MPGPLPNSQRRRRNQPTIPDSPLPAQGRAGRPPKSPLELGAAGKKWWSWAWATPQATKWDKGSHYTIAHRAQLEDDLAALDSLGGFRLDDYIDVSADDEEMARALEGQIATLKRLAGNRVAVLKECRELDKRLGLDPKALAELRWKLDDPSKDDGEGESGKAGPGDNVRTLRPKKK